MEGRLQAAERGGREGRRCPQGMMLSVSACSATSTFPASVVHCSWSSSATGLLGEAMGKKHGLGLDTWLQGWEDYRQSSQSSLRPFICTWSFCGASEHPQGAGRRPYRGHRAPCARHSFLHNLISPSVCSCHFPTLAGRKTLQTPGWASCWALGEAEHQRVLFCRSSVSEGWEMGGCSLQLEAASIC